MVGNVHSRAGARQSALTIQALKAAGLNLLQDETLEASQFETAIDGYRERIDRVVIIGGDGTVHRLLPALTAKGLTVGLVPSGTANDLAASLGIPMALEAACQVIAAGHQREIDVGVVNERLFLNVAHIGVGSRLTRSLDAKTKQRWGRLAYVRHLLRFLGPQPAFDARLTINGEERRVRAVEIAVGNGRLFGGGFSVHRNASLDDGLLHYSVFRPQPWRRMVATALRLRHGAHVEDPEVLAGEAKALSIQTRRPRTVVADGEEVATTPCQFNVRPGALKILVPRP